MEVIYSLIPGMTFFGLIMVAVLIWAVRKGQYEDMEGNASRILLDDDEDDMLAAQPKSKAPKEQAPTPTGGNADKQ
jgi:cbb3-type cytochrome oxidase maturation protein